MKISMIALALFVAGSAAGAASPFDGTWKGDPKATKLDPKPDVYLLANGSYSCKTCKPPVTFAADGKFHPVPGHDYYDQAALKIDNARDATLTRKRGPKLVATTTMKVSPDGKTLTLADERISDTGVKSSSTATATRVAPAPAGAHPISGSWKPAAIQAMSDTAMTQTLKVADGVLTLTTPTGEGYIARLGGPAVVQKNDPARTMIRVKQVAPNHIVEEDSRHGKVVMVFDMTVAPDGRTMTMAITDKRDDTVNTVKLTKQ